MKLLVVDSDRDMVEMITSCLKSHGYEVQRAYTGAQAKSKWTEYKPDLVIIDSALEDVNIFTLCRDLQTKHDALLLVMSEDRKTHAEVHCLESGADACLHKPFFPNQLLAHIHAISRRTRSTITRRPSSVIEVGPLSVHTLRNEVSIHNRTVRLTPTESKLLTLLATNANDVCTASQIVPHVWGFNNTGDAHLVKAHIYHLRQKIEPNPNHPRYILTVPGVGYTLVRRVTEESNPPLNGASRSLSLASN